MEMTFILTVALSVAIVLVIIILVATLLYYRWRNTELMSGIAMFVEENLKLRKEVERLKKAEAHADSNNTE